MARMHTRKRGRSKSHKPRRTTAPLWVPLSKEDIASAVLKLAKEGRQEAEIGLVLRDEYGVPSVKMLTGKTISQMLKENGLSPPYPSDLLDLIKRAVGMRKHLSANRKDTSNQTRLARVESKIKRLVKYYRGRRLPRDWKYDPQTAALLVK